MSTEHTQQDDFALADDLVASGIVRETAPRPARSLTEQRILAGFGDIVRFCEAHGHAPRSGHEADIFEQLYAVRLQCLRASSQAVALLAGENDRWGLLAGATPEAGDGAAPSQGGEALAGEAHAIDDDALAAALDGDDQTDLAESITTLRHVPYRKELNTADEIATQAPCKDFALFRPLFQRVAEGLKTGSIKSWKAREYNIISQGDFFILKGMIVYVAAILKARQGYDSKSERLRVIYANGTESDLLSSSLARALYKDKDSRKISQLDVDPSSAAPLFATATDNGRKPD